MEQNELKFIDLLQQKVTKLFNNVRQQKIKSFFFVWNWTDGKKYELAHEFRLVFNQNPIFSFSN